MRRRGLMASKEKLPPVPNNLSFVALEDGTFTFSSPCYYSLNNGKKWNYLNANTATPVVKSGNRICWKKDFVTLTKAETGVGHFSSSGLFNAEGKVMSMAYGDDFENHTTAEQIGQFNGLFNGCTYLYSAENIILPTSFGSSSSHVFCNMFQDCTSLIVAPDVIGVRMGNSCQNMFKGCSSLIEVPTITMSGNGSQHMFNSMFQNCTSLTSATVPFTALWYGWQCANMFKGCTNLEYAHIATKNLNYARELEYIFNGCTKLAYVKIYVTTTPTSTHTEGWLTNCAATGIFIKHIDATWDVTGSYGVPSGWTILYYNPSTDKYYLSDKTTECDDHGNVINA